MESFGKLYGDDADHLAEMFAAFPPRVRERYTAMTLHLWSHLVSTSGDPHVSVGRKTLAKECGVSERTARCYLEFMEREGFLVVSGTKKGSGGQYTIRSFWWHEGGRSHVHPLDVGIGTDVHRGGRADGNRRPPSETESQNSGESPHAAIAARFAALESGALWGEDA